MDTSPVWIICALDILNFTAKNENLICYLRLLVIYNV